MSTKIDQKAYLQKYLSGPSKDKKKKKKKVVKGSGFKIIDDDIDLTKLRPLDGDELDILDGGEDAPQIAGIIDERPDELKKLEQFKTSSKWRVINEDDGFNSKLQIQEIKKDIKETEKENEVIFGKMYSDSEDERAKNGSDLSPPRKSKHDQNSDFSPPRREKSPKRDIKYDSDASPPRKQETKSRRKPSRWGDAEPENNASPKRDNSKNHSPHDSSRRIRQNSDSDASPPRKRKSPNDKSRKRTPSSNLSPPRKDRPSRRDKEKNNQIKPSRTKNHDSDSDISPPRRNRSKNLSKDQSKRKYNSDSDLSPPRKDRYKDKRSKRKASIENRRSSDSDLSPPRKGKDKDIYYKRRNSDSPPPSNKKMQKTLEGKTAGLQDARQLRQENEEFRRKEDDVFKKLGDEVSGRNAKAVSRKSKRETSEERQKQREKADRQKELDAKYKVWSRGVKQMEAQEARVQEFLHEASKPLARHKGDRDLETNLKQIERAGDPMLDYIRERKRDRGELPPEKPSYKGNFPPNRFNIRPGYRWDGVDRSNGYEKKYFDQQSKKKAQEEEAYKWSTEDL